jgi:hypothetical protein
MPSSRAIWRHAGHPAAGYTATPGDASSSRCSAAELAPLAARAHRSTLRSVPGTRLARLGLDGRSDLPTIVG